MRQPSFAKRRAVNAPASGAGGKGSLDALRFVAAEKLGQTQRGRAGVHDALGRLGEKPFSGAIHQTQVLVAVESEDRDVDLLHHFAEQHGGFERAQSLLA